MALKKLTLEYTDMQQEVFFEHSAKYTILAAGRRSGKTHGASQFCLDLMLQPDASVQILWVDLVYSQIQNYFERYFLPTLKKIGNNTWSWNQQRKELTVYKSKMLFRSADRPDLLVGLAYNLIIVNEAGIALYEDPSLYTTILLPMLLDYPDSRLFAVGTPRGMLGKDGNENMFFKLFKRGQEGDPQVKSFKFSSYDNPQLSYKDIQELEEEVSPRERLQEIYAEFLDLTEVPIFDPAWWLYTEALPKPETIKSRFLSVDTAFGTKTVNDESAATMWLKTYDSKYYCVDCWHDRLDFPHLVLKMRQLINNHNPHYVLIENKASGQSLIQTLKQDLKIPIRAFEPNKERISDNYDKDKVSRAASVSGIIEKGNVVLLKAHWNANFVNQCTLFPVGNHDDICDTISQALIHSRNADFNLSQILSRRVQPKGVNEHALREYDMIKHGY